MYFLALNWLQYCLYDTGASCFIVNTFTEISDERLAQYCLFDTRIGCSIMNCYKFQVNIGIYWYIYI